MSIAENISYIKEKIFNAAVRADRDPNSVRLIAVSKTKPIEAIIEARSAGMVDFGENRPRELAEKYENVKDVNWHLIGQLQRNKVKYIIDKVALIHSVDSIALAQEIEKRAKAVNKVQKILIQVNISGEQTKSGITPQETVDICREISRLEHVKICGLMTISAKGFDFEQNYTVFKNLRDLSDEIKRLEIENVDMKELSMGMSHDYEAAVAAGTTMVRIGSAVFGSRDYNIQGK